MRWPFYVCRIPTRTAEEASVPAFGLCFYVLPTGMLNVEMNEGPSTSGPVRRSFWGRLGQMLAGEPRNQEELLEELRLAAANGLITRDTLAMIEGAMEVSDLRVADAMVPRAQMVMIGADASFAEVLAAVTESGHSRFPVHGEDKDEIRGILLAKDLLRFHDRSTDFDLAGLLRPVTLIPESMHLNVLLGEFRRNRNHMAVVVDEYGGVAGLITIEDVLEQIVGEIDDEHDDEQAPRIQPQPDGSYLVDALTPIDEFNEQLGSSFPDEAFDTVGGLVTDAIGHLPERDEQAELAGFVFRVSAADDRRVLQLRVTRAA